MGQKRTVSWSVGDGIAPEPKRVMKCTEDSKSSGGGGEIVTGSTNDGDLKENSSRCLGRRARIPVLTSLPEDEHNTNNQQERLHSR